MSGVMLASSPEMLRKSFNVCLSLELFRMHQGRSSDILRMRASASNPQPRKTLTLTVAPVSRTSSGALGLVCAYSSSFEADSYEQQSEGRRFEVESEFPKPPLISFQKELSNNIHLIGHVGKKPDIKYFDTGKVCARSSLAVRKTNRIDDPPSWFALEFWDELAEIAAHHLQKGEKIHVAGVVVVDRFEKDQETVTIAKVIVRDVNYVSNKFEAYADADDRSPQERRLEKEKLWQDVFGNPSDWWDNRLKKLNPRAPDFRHKTSGAALWIDSSPEWVRSQIQILDSRKDLESRSSRSVSSAPY